jgi:hypothetical protein
MHKRYRSSPARTLRNLGSCIGLLSVSALAQAELRDADDKASWEVFVSPYSLHWNHDDRHRHVYAAGVERIAQDDSLWGASLFRNSFGQASGYAYYGKQWDNFLGQPALYAKLTGGVMYGYRGEFRNKVPLNAGGFSPAIVPAVGYRFTDQRAVQVNVLGLAALMFSYNQKF